MNGISRLYDALGGMEGCIRLSERFHAHVSENTELRLHFPDNMNSVTIRFAWYLAEQTGGPKEYMARRGKNSLVCRHAHLRIGSEAGNAWMHCMKLALDDIEMDTDTCQTLLGWLGEIVMQLADPFLPFYTMPLDALRAALESDPTPAISHPHKRCLLGVAAGEWDVERVRLLLEFGADPAFRGNLGHDPICRAANADHQKPTSRESGNHAQPTFHKEKQKKEKIEKKEEKEEKGVETILLLVRHGASVNTVAGSESQTPLHMSARRGTVQIASALVDSGAEIDAQDSKGETPLRRAINCNQEELARFLISRGADPDLRDRKGVSPSDVAHRKGLCL